MRALALILILANLGFLGWSQLVDVRGSRNSAPEPLGIASAPRLVLSTEAGAAPSMVVPAAGTEFPVNETPVTAANETATVDAVVADDVTCVSVGAFRDLAEAVQASAALQTAGYFSRQRVDQGDVWLGYWVSVQNLATREAAEAALAELGRNGIADAYILPGSEPANVLSLGVFNDAARAQRRVEEISALGFDAVLADRRRAGSVYWVDVDLASPGAMFDPAVLQTQPGKIVRLEFRGCPDNGAPAGGPPVAVPDEPASQAPR